MLSYTRKDWFALVACTQSFQQHLRGEAKGNFVEFWGMP